MITVEGKNGIRATVVTDSISKAGVRFTTFEIEYPRLILAELNTHRMLSKNSASSRAIPFVKMVKQLFGKPVRFGAANAGMQDKGDEHNGVLRSNSGEAFTPEEGWDEAREEAIKWSERFFNAGYHKQVYNRLTEPFQMMKTVISGTEWPNFFWLRKDSAADPTLYELARCMYEALQQSVPQVLEAGEWHLPYVDTVRDLDGNKLKYGDWVDLDGTGEYFIEYSLNEAIQVSCARSAAVSFRNVDYGLEKCKEVYERLVGDQKKHGSAMEHAATPMKQEIVSIAKDDYLNMPQFPSTWEEGITHMDRKKRLWSGNIRGWIQHRKLIPGENYEGGE